MQEKAEEMQAFVEVLLENSEAQPEALEASRAQARLKAENASLKSRLDGPERQRELDDLRQLEVHLSFCCMMKALWVAHQCIM